MEKFEQCNRNRFLQIKSKLRLYIITFPPGGGVLTISPILACANKKTRKRVQNTSLTVDRGSGKRVHILYSLPHLG